MGPENIAPLLGIPFFFGIPLLAIWTSHQRKMAEIKAKGTRSNDSALKSEIEALRQEVAILRDTATKFDLSFDAQLTQLEARMEKVESAGLSRYQTTEEKPRTQHIGTGN